MTDATVIVGMSGNVVISNVHPGTGEGWRLVVPPSLPVEVQDHHYDDEQQRVVIVTTSYPTLADAMRYVASGGGAGMSAA